MKTRGDVVGWVLGGWFAAALLCVALVVRDVVTGDFEGADE